MSKYRVEITGKYVTETQNSKQALLNAIKHFQIDINDSVDSINKTKKNFYVTIHEEGEGTK